jgi:quercetin dioxygenase-like cupin family protein
MSTPPIRRQLDAFRWQGVDVLAYKEEGSAPFRGVTRQVLFADRALGCELRYFEVAPGGHTTLERHEHAHAVVIQRGHGACLVGFRVDHVRPLDLVHIPALTWHQLQADDDGPLGFLCMVNAKRDRPELPDADALAALRRDRAVAAFLDRSLSSMEHCAR